MTQGKARSGFDVDLRDGEAREDAFVYTFLRARVEHKSDEACRRTGNVFIEYRQKGRPSGIAVTTAERWAIEYDGDCWLVVPTPRLKAITRLAYRDPKKRVKGGDGNQYDGVLVPVEWLVRPLARLMPTE